MLIWLQNHIFTILICAVLIAFFGWLVYTLIRDKKQGKSSCCGGCAGCAMAGHCHPHTVKPADTAENKPADTAENKPADTAENKPADTAESKPEDTAAPAEEVRS